MFSPLNDPTIADWFNRLDAAWRRLPEAERTRQREEVQQHLESLVAAKVAEGQTSEEAWSVALAQFGDPTQIGRKLYREWKQSKVGFRAEMSAILFALELQVLIRLFFVLFGLMMVIGIPPIVCVLLYLACFPLACVFVGRRYPMQAIKGVFYAGLLCSLWMGVEYQTSPVRFLASTFIVVSFQVLIAYLASVTKRGWYKPTLADFKLTLPAWRQISR